MTSIIENPIVDNKRLKFIHITKCAGTNVEELGKNQPGVYWGRYDREFQKGIKAAPPPWSQSWWLYPPQYMEAKYLTSLLEKYDFFTVVRNPYDRVISEYYSEWGGPRFKAKHVDEFNEYIHDRLTKIQFDIRSGTKMNGHYVPQHMYVVDAPTVNSEGELEARMICNNIIHLENFFEEFNALMEKYEYDNIRVNKNDVNMDDIDKLQNVMSVPRNYSFIRQKVSQFTKFDLNQENIELIQSLYEQDFELFNYSSQLVPVQEEEIMECGVQENGNADAGVGAAGGLGLRLRGTAGTEDNEEDWEDIPGSEVNPRNKKRSLDEQMENEVSVSESKDSYLTGKLTITINANKNKRRIVSTDTHKSPKHQKTSKSSSMVGMFDNSGMEVEKTIEDEQERLLKQASKVQGSLSTGLSSKRSSGLPPVPNFGSKSWADYDEDSDDDMPARKPIQPQEPEQRVLSTYSTVEEDRMTNNSEMTPAPVIPIAVPARPKFRVGSSLYKKDGESVPIRLNVSVAPIIPLPADAFNQGITGNGFKSGTSSVGSRHNKNKDKSKSIQSMIRDIGNQ